MDVRRVGVLSSRIMTTEPGWESTTLAQWIASESTSPVDHGLLTSPRSVAFEVGEPLVPYCGTPREWVFVAEGVMMATQATRSGRECVVERVSPMQGSGLLSTSLISRTCASVDFIAATTGRAVVIGADAFQRCFDSIDWFRAACMLDIARAFSGLTGELVGGSRPLASRIAGLILERARPHGESGNPEIRITHEQLARELGAARETVSRNLRTLDRAGAITSARGMIAVANATRLRSYADGTT